MQTRVPLDRISLIAIACFTLLAVPGVGCSGCDDTEYDLPDAGDRRDDEGPPDAADTRSRRDGTEPADSDDATTSDRDATDSSGHPDGNGRDDATTDTADGDARAGDTADGTNGDTRESDTTTSDTGGADDTGPGDTRSEDTGPIDTRSGDTAPADTGNGDTVRADTSSADATDAGSAPTGLSTRCSNGPGWTLFKFHWARNGGPSPRIDVWDASCNYSYAPNSACNVQRIRNPGFNSRSPKAVLLSGGKFLRVRFSVQGLSFSKADVYVQARSYSTTASTDFEVWSPLYGAKRGGLVDNDFVYDWYHVPWTGYLTPSDKPSLTAIDISDLGGDELAVHAVELCVR